MPMQVFVIIGCQINETNRYLSAFPVAEGAWILQIGRTSIPFEIKDGEMQVEVDPNAENFGGVWINQIGVADSIMDYYPLKYAQMDGVEHLSVELERPKVLLEGVHEWGLVRLVCAIDVEVEDPQWPFDCLKIEASKLIKQRQQLFSQ